MDKKIRFIVYAAIIGAMYFVLTHMQNILLPGSATWAIQCRMSEALGVLAFFTPAAIPGLTVGCFLFNISYAGALPLDILVGSLATLLSSGSMWLLRKHPMVGLTMPALFNAFLVGWELTVYIGDTGFTLAAFWLNAFQVALGELIVLFIPGLVLYRAIKSRNLDKRLFA